MDAIFCDCIDYGKSSFSATAVCDPIRLFKRQVIAVEHMKAGGRMTSLDYAKLFNVTDRTARMDLTGLIEKGIVKKTGSGMCTR